MTTKKQIVECLNILITKVDTINERTKKHTKEIKELKRDVKSYK